MEQLPPKNKERIPTRKEKARIWEELSVMVESTTDGLEEKIDEGIKEAVIGCNALGINTTQSCEGHAEKEIAAPWIDIEARENIVLYEELEKGEPSKEQGTILKKKIEKANLEERKKILVYLEEFYKNRKVPFEQQLTIQGKGLGRSRLESQGADLQKFEPERRKRENLQKYQTEMRESSEFLKKEFFKK